MVFEIHSTIQNTATFVYIEIFAKTICDICAIECVEICFNNSTKWWFFIHFIATFVNENVKLNAVVFDVSYFEDLDSKEKQNQWLFIRNYCNERTLYRFEGINNNCQLL